MVYSPAMHWMFPPARKGCVSTRPRALAFSVAISLWLATPIFAVEEPAHGRLPDLDRRRENAPMVEVLPQDRLQAAAVLQKQVRDVTVEHDELLRSPRFIGSTTHFLTGPEGEGGAIGPQAAAAVPKNDPHRTTRAFLQEHAALFGHADEVLREARVVRDYVTAHNGMRTVVWEQFYQDLPVFEAVLTSHLTRRGELINLSSQFVPDTGQAVARALAKVRPAAGQQAAEPVIADARALAISAQNLGEAVTEADVSAVWEKPVGPERKQRFRSAKLVGEAKTRLTWLPMNGREMRLCWEVELTRPTGGETYQALVDARSGEVLVRRCRTFYLSDATYRVFTSDSPSPFSPGHPAPSNAQPPLVERSLITLPALNTNASPLGWINDGLNETLGNNIAAHLDRNADNQPDLPRPRGNPWRVFDPPLSLTNSPTTYGDAAVVQLFYWCNWMHDRLYELGFTEAAGNFQKDNFGRGGADNDPILADAQDGSGFNNANFTPSRDGEPGRIQMYVFNGPEPDRDGDLDAEVILHEYAHGLTDRMVGGNVGIYQWQSYGLAEGWSDFYALAMLGEANDDLGGNFAVGGYLTYRFFGLTQNYYFGIRRYPYSTNVLVNPLTLIDMDPGQAGTHPGIPFNPVLNNKPSEASRVHAVGEIWCLMLVEARANLIAKYGFAQGNQLILQLVTDGLKLSPPNPNFAQARDAILQADLVNHGGANQNELWSAFAKRGLGTGAICPPNYTTEGVYESYAQPDVLTVLPGTPLIFTGPAGGPFSPSCRTLLLTNATPEAQTWAAGTPSKWFKVSPSAGALAPGTGTLLNVCLTTNVNALTNVTAFEPVYLTNLTSGRLQVREAQARVLHFAAMPFAEGFESGRLQAGWTVTGEGGISSVVTTNFAAHAGERHLVMSAATDGHYTRNEATLGLDLAGFTNVVLRFWARSLGEEPDGPPPSPFHDGANFDGVAISTDGIVWHEVQGLRNLSDSYTELVVNLDAAVLAHGMAYTSRFLIRFNQYDNNRAPDDGIALDDISITGKAPSRFVVMLPESVREGDGLVTNLATVSLPEAVMQDLVIQLQSSGTNQLRVPASVTLPAGSNSVALPLDVVEDANVDGPQEATITASAAGFVTGAGTLVVKDNETSTLFLILPAQAREGDGDLSKEAYLVSTEYAGADLLIALESSDSNELTVPPWVVLPKGQFYISLPVAVVDDRRIDGPQTAAVAAWMEGWTGATNSLTILDNETSDLHLSVPPVIIEGAVLPLGVAAVSLSGTLPTNLVVAVTNSDTNLLTTAVSVTVPAGQFSAALPLAALDNSTNRGDLSATISIGAPGFSGDQAAIRILDNDAPPLPFNPTPAHLATNQAVSLSLRWQLGVPGLLTNGGFEAGTFDGWRQRHDGDGAWVVNDGTLDPPGPEGLVTPVEGRFSAVAQQNGPGTRTLYQDVTVPVSVSAAWLTWSHRVRNYGPGFGGSQGFRVEVRTADDVVLAVAYATQAGDPLLGEWTRQTFDLLSFRGQPIRIAFIEEDTLGYCNVHLDDVQVLLSLPNTPACEVYLGTGTNLGPENYLGTTTGTFWFPPSLALNTTYRWQVVTRLGEKRATGPVWQFRTRGVGPLHHLAWGPIAPTQTVLQPFPVRVAAVDDIGNPVTNFTGPVTLSATAERAIEPVQVLTFTGYSDLSGDYRRTLAAISASFTNYVETNTTIEDPVGLASLLLNKDIFIVVAQDNTPSGRMAELGVSWGPTLSNFVWRGGSVVVCSYLRDEHQLLANSGLLSLKKEGTSATSLLDAPAVNHALLSGVTLPFTAQSVARYSVSNGLVVLQTSTVVTTNAVVIEQTIGLGRLVMLGSDYSVNRTELDKVLANAVRRQQAPNSQPLALSPITTGYFQNGIWTGQIAALGIGRNAVLRADDNAGHRGDSAALQIEAVSDLSISIADAPDPASVGQEVTYRITARNQGSVAYSGVQVVDALPPGLEFLRATNSFGTVTMTSNAITFALGTLAGGESAEVFLVARPLVGGTINNPASISATVADSYLANNTAYAITRVNSPLLAISDALVFNEGNVGDQEAVFTVQLSPPSTEPVSVRYATSNLTATAGSDYDAVSGVLSFAPGETNLPIRVRVHGDFAYENFESFTVRLQDATNALIIDSEGLGILFDDDPVPSVTIADASVLEGSGGTVTGAVFHLTLTGLAGANVAVNYSATNGTAEVVSDFQAVSGTVVFTPGMTVQDIVVQILGDDRAETNEIFLLNLTGVGNATLARSQAIGTILDDDAGKLDGFAFETMPSPRWINTPFSVSISARDALGQLVSGFNGSVQLGGLSDHRTVEIGSATNTWEWPLGAYFHDERTQVIYLADEIGGPTRLTALALDIAAPPGQILSNWTVRVKHTLKASYNTPAWEDADWTTVYRGEVQVLTNGWANFVFERPFEFNGLDNLLVDFSFDNALYTVNGLCRATPTSTIRSLHFRTDSAFGDPRAWAGQQPPPLAAKRIPNVRFTTETPLALTPPVAGPFVNGAWAGQITVRQSAESMALRAEDGFGHRGISAAFPVFALDDISLILTDTPDPVRLGEPLTYQLTITNTGPSSATGVMLTNLLPANAELISFDTTPGQCHNELGQIICQLGTLAANQTANVTVVVRPLTSSTITNRADITRTETDANPANNRAITYTSVRLPSITLGDLAVNEDDAGINHAPFTVTLSGPSLETVSLSFATAHGTAANNLDYLPTNGVMIFPPGTVSQTIALPIVGDTLRESNETFTVNLSKPAGVTLDRPTATITILDDDPMPSVSVSELSLVEGDDGTSLANLSIDLSAPSGQYIYVRLSTSNGTATALSDFLPRANFLVLFPPGFTNRTIAVLIYGDRLTEADETFTAWLSAPINATMGRPVATVTLLNDDAIAGKLDHFAWETIPSPQYAAQPFVGTISARDIHQNVVTNFTGNVSLEARTGLLDVALDSGTGTWPQPFATSTRQARTQVIYLPAELGGPRPILGLALDVLLPPGQVLTRWTLRLRHTSQTNYAGAGIAWETNGWTTAHQASTLITNTGWTSFAFAEPFLYDGTNSLLVDFSFSNPVFTSDGACRITNTPTARAIYLQADGAFGDPLNWSGANSPKPTLSSALPNVRFLSGRTVLLAPNLSGQFNSGVWSGMLSVSAPATNLYLVSTDAYRRTATSPLFTVEPFSDADTDSLPDSWEIAHFGSLNSPVGAPEADADADHFSTRQEFLAGTDPLDAASALRIISARWTEAGVVIRFSSVAGKGYRIERTASLKGPWSTVTNLVPGTGELGEVVDASADQGGLWFYRIRLAP